MARRVPDAPVTCGLPMHKNCNCVRVKGHAGECNCNYRDVPGDYRSQPGRDGAQ